MIRFVNGDVDVATERTLRSMNETDEYEISGLLLTCSMLPSLDPTERNSDCRVRTYSPASSGDLYVAVKKRP